MFACKSNEHVDVTHACASLVARGFKQREGIDFLETSAPTPTVSGFRVVVAIACEFGVDWIHCDVDQALVQSRLEGYVFTRPTPDCGERSRKVVRLSRSLWLKASDVVAQLQ